MTLPVIVAVIFRNARRALDSVNARTRACPVSCPSDYLSSLSYQDSNAPAHRGSALTKTEFETPFMSPHHEGHSRLRLSEAWSTDSSDELASAAVILEVLLDSHQMNRQDLRQMDMIRRKRSHVIVDEFLRLIATGDLSEGAMLPTEPELCARFDVGRSTAREAIQTLAAKGVVTVKHGSGTVVAPRWQHHQLDPDYLAIMGHGDALPDLVIEAREILEPMIAPLAAQRATADDLARLNELVEELAAVGEADPDVHARVDIAFHQTLAAASGNPVLSAMHDLITQLGLELRKASVQVPGAVDRAVTWHRHIFEAMEARDPSAVADAMRMHLRQARSEIEHARRDGTLRPEADPTEMTS